MKTVRREVVWEGELFDVVREQRGDTVRELAEHEGETHHNWAHCQSTL